MDVGIPVAFWQLMGRLGLAVVVGSALGINRDLHRKPAGIRTHALVLLGTALVTLMVDESTDPDAGAVSRVIQGLVTGIGFLGAGVIIHHDAEHRVEGLTTAASIWMTAIFGIACGAGQVRGVLAGLGLALLVLTCGKSIENAMARWLGRRDDG